MTPLVPLLFGLWLCAGLSPVDARLSGDQDDEGRRLAIPRHAKPHRKLRTYVNSVPGSYIVVFAPNANASSVSEQMANGVGTVEFVFDGINGAQLSNIEYANLVEKVLENDSVDYVEQVSVSGDLEA